MQDAPTRRRLLESPKLAFSDTESRISADDVQREVEKGDVGRSAVDEVVDVPERGISYTSTHNHPIIIVSKQRETITHTSKTNHLRGDDKEWFVSCLSHSHIQHTEFPSKYVYSLFREIVTQY